jgi:hypothetical protein
VLEDGPRCRTADAEDIRQSDLNSLVSREVGSRNSSHVSPLPLLVARVLTNDPHAPMAPDDPALLTHLLGGC